MANEVDQDRLDDSLRGANVIDLDLFRMTAARDNKTATPYIAPGKIILWIAIFILAIWFFNKIGR